MNEDVDILLEALQRIAERDFSIEFEDEIAQEALAKWAKRYAARAVALPGEK